MLNKATVLRLLQNLEVDFNRERNPVFAWSAIGLCRELRLNPPDWVMIYLSEAARVMSNTAEVPSEQTEAEKVGRALGFGRGQGKTSSFERAYIVGSNRVLYKKVVSYIRENRKPPFDPYKQVAILHACC